MKIVLIRDYPHQEGPFRRTLRKGAMVSMHSHLAAKLIQNGIAKPFVEETKAPVAPAETKAEAEPEKPKRRRRKKKDD